MAVYQYENKFYDLPDGLSNEEAISRIQTHLKTISTATSPREWTQTQKTYQAVRPYVAPTVEALTSVAGGLAGTPRGPLGMLSGTGLGYGIGKEAMELADVYIGEIGRAHV